jgi:isopenicillin-N N-acyltransferase-like protein
MCPHIVVRSLAMGKSEELQPFEASGDHYRVGCKIGEHFADIAKRMNRIFRESSPTRASLRNAIAYDKKIHPYVKEFYPGFLDELRGYSEASEVPLQELMAQWFGYDRKLTGARKACTDLAVSSEVTKDGCVYVAHNEDYFSVYDGLVVPVHIKVTGKPEFFAMSYGGIFPTMGFNSAGISLTGNELNPNDRRLGIPKFLPPRKVMEATSILEALGYSTPEKRGDSFNNIVCTAEGELYSMEASATQFEAIYGKDGFLVHTNHFTQPKMLKFEANSSPFSSILRYNRALKLLRSELGKVAVDTIMKIQSDHVGYPWSICRHEVPQAAPQSKSKTLFGSVINLTEKTVLICQGNPCGSSYLKYKLGE